MRAQGALQRAPIALRSSSDELLDAARLVGGGGATKEARVELVGDLRVLEPLGEPVEDAGHEVGRQVVTDLAPLDAPADERLRAVRVLVGEPADDVALDREVRAVVADEGDPVARPVVADEVPGPVQPVADGGEEAALDDVGGRILPAGEGADGRLVRREEQPGLGIEVREHRAFGDPQLGGDGVDPRALVAVLRELADRDGDDRLPLGRQPGRAR